MIFLDIETTGTDPQAHCMLSLGAVDTFTGKTFYGECCMYPHSQVDLVALKINGFTLEDITPPRQFHIRRPGKDWAFVLLQTFLAWVDQFPDKLLAGHNIGHLDLPFLEQERKKLPLATPWPFGYRTVDLHTVAFLILGESLSHAGICGALGLPEEPKPHNALQGALSEALCYERLMRVGK